MKKLFLASTIFAAFAASVPAYAAAAEDSPFAGEVLVAAVSSVTKAYVQGHMGIKDVRFLTCGIDDINTDTNLDLSCSPNGSPERIKVNLDIDYRVASLQEITYDDKGNLLGLGGDDEFAPDGSIKVWAIEKLSDDQYYRVTSRVTPKK